MNIRFGAQAAQVSLNTWMSFTSDKAQKNTLNLLEKVENTWTSNRVSVSFKHIEDTETYEKFHPEMSAVFDHWKKQDAKQPLYRIAVLDGDKKEYHYLHASQADLENEKEMKSVETAVLNHTKTLSNSMGILSQGAGVVTQVAKRAQEKTVKFLMRIFGK